MYEDKARMLRERLIFKITCSQAVMGMHMQDNLGVILYKT